MKFEGIHAGNSDPWKIDIIAGEKVIEERIACFSRQKVRDHRDPRVVFVKKSGSGHRERAYVVILHASPPDGQNTKGRTTGGRYAEVILAA
jgi:hypothetical protein